MIGEIREAQFQAAWYYSIIALAMLVDAADRCSGGHGSGARASLARRGPRRRRVDRCRDFRRAARAGRTWRWPRLIGLLATGGRG